MKEQMRIGEFLVSKKILTPQQVDRILEYSKMRRLRFGEAGMELGYLSRESFIKVFGPTFAVDFFKLDPKFFPKKTQPILSLETVLKYGVLPLGFKSEKSFFKSKTLLNLGFLSPYRKEFISEVIQLADLKKTEFGFEGTKIYIIIADQFLRVLDQVYGVSESQLHSYSPEKFDPTLRMFLEDLRESPVPDLT